ncbi:hypothetical protein OSB04_005741 [Centaurea solstitialis]|uniref:Uncharacterized protein n=1 Tax=Centaurea solstitialis TaxID=347529 RepID=A0AA38TUH3_9ASTR|nr:hypothetical protein OSB04_005741 [Centaurea solstitialis]
MGRGQFPCLGDDVYTGVGGTDGDVCFRNRILYGTKLSEIEFYLEVHEYRLLSYHHCHVISREAEDFGLGKINYYMILSISVVLWQCFFLGAIGVIFYGSSLLLGVIVTIQIPVTEILGVIFYKEKFKTEKGVALVLSIWGFISYFYGEYKHMKISKDDIQSTHEVAATVDWFHIILTEFEPFHTPHFSHFISYVHPIPRDTIANLQALEMEITGDIDLEIEMEIQEEETKGRSPWTSVTTSFHP